MLLGTSSTCVKATVSTETSDGKGEGVLDITSGEKKLNKNFICNNLWIYISSTTVDISIFIYSQKLDRNEV